MYGVTKNIDLSAFVGSTLEQLAIGTWQIVFHFDPSCSIASEGTWVLLSPDGATLDQSTKPEDRDCYRVHVCLGKRVVAATVAPPDSIILRFETGHVLRFVDDSEQYESFHIQPGDLHV